MSAAVTTERVRDLTPAERDLSERFDRLPKSGVRADLFDAFAQTGLPHRRMEAWKWSDFRASVGDLKTGGKSRKPLRVEGGIEVRFTGDEISIPDDLPDGLNMFVKTEAQGFGDAELMPLGALAASLVGKTVMVEVTKPVLQPVHMIFDGAGEGLQVARIAFVVREGASLSLVESHVGGAGFSDILMEFGLQAGASVDRTIYQSARADEAVAITTTGHLATKAHFAQTVLAFGAKISRIETRLAYTGAEAKAEMNAAYLARAGHHVDITSHVDHGAESCVTRQVTKGAVTDGGRGIFQGKFLVPRTVGQFTDADMQHNALLLENGAEVFAKPELEIYADDVECAHGNTSGQLDESALFYMRQRGISLNEARALLTEAFIAEALEAAHETVRDQLLEQSRNFLSEEV